MKIYAISGLGANQFIYEKLRIPEKYELVHIPWMMPLQEESIQSYAHRMAAVIDDTADFILFGLSFGGIMAQEIAKIKSPTKLILFNTIKNEKEKPLWISINNQIPFYLVFPNFLLNNHILIAFYSWCLSLFNPNRPDLSRIYTFRHRDYTHWAFKQIVKWENNRNDDMEIYHLHGTQDFIFPISKIQNPIRVEKGSHICVYEKATLVSEILEQILA